MEGQARFENKWALVGLVLCVVEFIGYLFSQWGGGSHDALDDQIAEASVEAIRDGRLTLRGAMAKFRENTWSTLCGKGELEEALMNKDSMDEVKRMCKVLAPFFAIYDINHDNQIDFDEFQMIFKDVHENITKEAKWRMFRAADTDSSGYISFEEFVACLMSFALDPNSDIKEQKQKQLAAADAEDKGAEEDDEDDEEPEEEDMPEDLSDLEPAEQQRRIKMRAWWKMGIGTLLVVIFSDPMCATMAEIGYRIGCSPFYVSFVLAPMASNASEMVSAYNYASKRTSKSMTTALSTLEGAAVMNNTFCLGIFLALVYFRNLAWTFGAETICTVFVEIAVGISAMTKSVHRLADGLLVLCFYPISLGLCWTLENKFGWD